MLEIYDENNPLDRHRLKVIMFCAYMDDTEATQKEIEKYRNAIIQGKRDAWTDAIEMRMGYPSRKNIKAMLSMAAVNPTYYELLMNTSLVDALIEDRLESESEMAMLGALKFCHEEAGKLYQRVLGTLTRPRNENGFGFSPAFAEEIIERFCALCK